MYDLWETNQIDIKMKKAIYCIIDREIKRITDTIECEIVSQ